MNADISTSFRHISGISCYFLIILVAGSATAEFQEKQTSAARVDVLLHDTKKTDGIRTLEITGKYLKSGSQDFVGGELIQVEDGCYESIVPRIPLLKMVRKWIAFIHVKENGQNCNLFEKLQRIFLYGASAILIFTINSTVLNEFDTHQIFQQPIVLLYVAENVTEFLERILLSIRVSSTVEPSYLQKVPSVTLWSTCGFSRGTRFKEFICMERNGNKDTSSIIGFLLAIVFSFFVMLLVTGRSWYVEDPRESSVSKMVFTTLASLEIRRYPQCTTENDICAICLEEFHFKQKVRVLPCVHHFHVRCVDRWLISHHTCPLCKRNVLGALESLPSSV